MISMQPNNHEGHQDRYSVDCAFPGGNIIVDRIEDDAVFMHQDLRDTSGDWFYWCFRVRGAAGRTLTFHFTKGHVIGVRGPAFSTDGGRTWEWLGEQSGEQSADHTSFVYVFAPDADEVRFCFGMPYQEVNLNEFIRCHAHNPRLKVERLCQTEKGRQVERLHLGCVHSKANWRVLLTCRHHCCEMMASYALEGTMEAVLGDTDAGRWFGENVEFLMVPFVDKDGVEDGDQGKNRKPYDHNRDYGESSLYSSVKALRAFLPCWSEGRLRVALDLHCPWIRGPHNEVIYLVGSASEGIWQEQCHFSRILEAVQTGPLTFSAKDNLPFGQGWNTAENVATGKSCSQWTSELPGVQLASTIELPYANASGKEVNPKSAKAFGYDLATALYGYLNEAGSFAPPEMDLKNSSR